MMGAEKLNIEKKILMTGTEYFSWAEPGGAFAPVTKQAYLALGHTHMQSWMHAKGPFLIMTPPPPAAPWLRPCAVHLYQVTARVQAGKAGRPLAGPCPAAGAYYGRK